MCIIEFFRANRDELKISSSNIKRYPKDVEKATDGCDIFDNYSNKNKVIIRKKRKVATLN